jgi:formylglycine-generating enzyme required for sulfatase activity
MKNDNSGKCLKLFIGSSDEGRRSDVKIRAELERFPIKIIHWRRIFPTGTFNLEALLSMLPKIDAALFIATPDDETKHRGKIKPQPRDNIIFEFGLCMGKLGRKHVSMVLVEKNGQFPKLPSDLEGLGLIRYYQDKPAQFELKLEEWISSIISENKLEEFDDDEPVEEGEESIEVAEEEVVEDGGNDGSDAGDMKPEKPETSPIDYTSEQVLKEPPDKDIRDRMVEISPGTFTMGDNKTGQVEVTISRSFFMDTYPVTQALYQEIMNKNPSRFRGDDLPVEKVSWFDAIDFCNELSMQSGLGRVYEVKGKKVKIHYERDGYRLPTEAEWEYACRGKTPSERYGKLDAIAWYSKNSGHQTQGVGQKSPNEYGLFDMLGNVWEWCNDYWYPKYPEGSQEDPIGPDDGFDHILRGGSWASFDNIIRSAHRGRQDHYIRDDDKGFRIVRSLNQ